MTITSDSLTLDIKEDHFFPETIRVFCSDNVLSSVVQFDPVDYEGVVISMISFHELD